MSDNLKKLADKFFINQCNSQEAKKVLEWLDTPEGQQYLSEKMDDDITSYGEEEDTETDRPEAELSPQLGKMNPERHYNEIWSAITKRGRNRQKKRDLLAPFLKIAAGLLVIAAASVFVYTSGPIEHQEEPISETVL